MNRLLILACSETKRDDAGRIPALLRYDGPLWQTLRTVDPEGRAAKVAFLSAHYGFGDANDPIKSYNARLTPTLARAMIDGGMTTRWPRPPNPNRPDSYGVQAAYTIARMTNDGAAKFSEVCLVGGHLYLDVMRSFVEGFRREKCLPRSARVVEINGPIGLMRQSLRAWIEQRDTVTEAA